MTTGEIAVDNVGRRRALWLYATCLLSALVTYLSLGPIAWTLGQFELGQGPSPYFIPRFAVWFNLLIPLGVVGIGVFLISPGLVIAAGMHGSRDTVGWILRGFAISLALVTISAIAVQLVTGSVLFGRSFFFLVLVLLLGAVVYSQWIRRVRLLAFEVATGDMVAAAGAGFLVLALMSAKFYWENFSPDGAGVLYFSRLLVYSNWPFWPPESGAIQQAPGLTSFLFVLPASWFVRLLGENEFAVRAPHVLYVGLLFVVLLGLIRHARQVQIRVHEYALIALALMLYSLSVIYSGGYNPYFGDSPMPGARETMVVALFLGFVYAFASDQRGLMVLTGILGYLALPTGGLWLLLWFAAVIATWRPLPYARLAWTFGIMVFCAVLGMVAPMLITFAGLPFPGTEFNFHNVVSRLRYVSFFDLNRVAFFVVPLGIVPFVSLFYWRRQDQLSRALTLASVVFFLFFYLQGYRVLLHHFIPAMIPPLVVLWRTLTAAEGRVRSGGALAVLAGLAVGLVLAFPNKPGLHAYSREIGRTIELRGPQLEGFKPVALDTAHTLFGELFPIQWADGRAEVQYVGGPLVWFHYAREPKPDGQVINYVLQPETDPAPTPEASLFGTKNGYALWILDEALYRKHFETGFTTHFGAEIFYTSRDEMFGRGARRGDRYVIDIIRTVRDILGIRQPDT